MPVLSVVTFSPGRANLSAACAAVCSKARGLKSWPPESHARAATNTAPRVEVSLGCCLHEFAGYGLVAFRLVLYSATQKLGREARETPIGELTPKVTQASYEHPPAQTCRKNQSWNFENGPNWKMQRSKGQVASEPNLALSPLLLNHSGR